MNKKFLLILVAALTILTTSCKKYLDKAYNNPNLPTTESLENILQGVIGSIPRGVNFDYRNIGPYIQYISSTTSFNAWERHGYAYGAGSGNNGADIWRMHYFTFGHNILEIIKKAEQEERPDFSGAAYALFAYSWLNTADVYGEIIYKEAFRRDQLSFNFDNQDQVYPHVIKLADSALYFFNRTAVNTLGAGDLYFNKGSIDKWKKFAFAMKAKAYHRYYNKANYSADSVIKYCNLAMGSTADDILLTYNPLAADASGINFFGPTRGNLPGFRAGAFAMNLMNGNINSGVVDPRVRYIFKPAADGVFRGLVQNAGEPAAVPAAQKTFNFYGFVSVVSPTGGIDTGARTYFKNTSSSMPITTYAEMQFMKAEAAHKKGDFATALTAYTNGISGNMDMLTTHFTGYTPITAADKTAFLANPLIVPTTAASLTLGQILRQKYIALWGWGFVETWVDMRKHNYDVTNIYSGYKIPTTANDLFPDNAGKLAYRIRPRYDSEFLWNAANLNAIGGLNMDYHTKPVWFSQP